MEGKNLYITFILFNDKMAEQNLPISAPQPPMQQVGPGISQPQSKPLVKQDTTMQNQNLQVSNQQQIQPTTQQIPPEQMTQQQDSTPKKKKNWVMWIILIFIIIIALGLGYYLLIK